MTEVRGEGPKENEMKREEGWAREPVRLWRWPATGTHRGPRVSSSQQVNTNVGICRIPRAVPTVSCNVGKEASGGSSLDQGLATQEWTCARPGRAPLCRETFSLLFYRSLLSC